jgi:transketolase
MNSFGESAPGPALMKEFGFTIENVVDAVEDVIYS